MKIKLILVVSLIFLLTGCATGRNLHNLDKKVEVLESRVNSVEERQNAIETQTGQSRESVGYVKGKIDNMSKGPSAVVVKGVEGNKGYIAGTHKKALSEKEIQIALKNAGFYSGEVDGKIGKGTKKAIKEFQKVNGLKADGIVSKKTASLLAQYLKE